MSDLISTDNDAFVTDVITKEVQDQLTPDEVLDRLKAGNARYVAGQMTVRNQKAQIPKATAGQHPKAIVLSCVDSRVPVEIVFDSGIGDMFVARVAGNFVNTDILGSMEYACKVAGSKLVLVMGHESCGAVKSAIDSVELGNITEMLAKIGPAIEGTTEFENDRNSGNADYVKAVTERNVRLNVERIRAESPILKELEDEGTIAIRGAVYSLQDGVVTVLD